MLLIINFIIYIFVTRSLGLRLIQINWMNRVFKILYSDNKYTIDKNKINCYFIFSFSLYKSNSRYSFKEKSFKYLMKQKYINYWLLVSYITYNKLFKLLHLYTLLFILYLTMILCLIEI